ncbi:hypothetical protein TTHERM_00864860 (macronuclear) [Tetrahymena thermophila SB210]|uniref:Uncharacterized protein n=1 Tax=Tetrahymena thermophila (strain SB210) TaxID=312017 RepID=Q24FH7_TETTS|nr:hypothetical protein TTHERM_00864860 [Tetrahymena thermophila SB210]EAS06481.1 hypothetical protein TTHERM_00864860 [Tetrahymena thermophila SB210]|eukprot:XP_001026726.1 hypothetical protein TTHERM_00864860 [Tetrahymena thermophila SB210]
MQRIEQKQQQDPQQQQQKLEMIKKELQKYRELKKSPSLSSHLSAKQLQKCSDTEKRKQILNYINSTQLEQDNMNISQTNCPQTSRNFQENQSMLNQKREGQNDFVQKNPSNKFFQSIKNRENQERFNLDFMQKDSRHISNENQKNSSSNNTKSNSISINPNKEIFREITLADVQNFEMENQQVCFNQDNNYGGRDTNRHNKLNFLVSNEQQQLNPKYPQEQRNMINNSQNGRVNDNLQDLDDEDVYQQITFEDLRVKHQGIYNFKDLNGQNNIQENNQKNNKNLSLNNLEENHHQSSWASTLPSNRNEYEKNQQLNQQNLIHKSQLHNFMTSQNTLASQMSQKLHSIGSGRLNQSNLSSDQQIPTLKDCASTSTNSKPQCSSNQTLSSKGGQFNSKSSQGYLEYVMPRNLNIRPESLEDISKISLFQRNPLEEKESQKSIQNIIVNNTQQKKNIYHNPLQKTNQLQLNNQLTKQTAKVLSLNTSKISPPVSPKTKVGQDLANKTMFQSDTKKLKMSASLSPNSKSKQPIKTTSNLNKENNLKQNSEQQGQKEDLQFQAKYSKLNQIIQQKASTTKCISSHQQQPYFKSIKGRHDKTSAIPKELSKTNTSNLKINIPTSIPQEKSKQTQSTLKSTPQKQSQNQDKQQQVPQLSQIKEEVQLQEKQNFIIKKLTEEQFRWKEIGSQMVLAYEELNQNFKLLVKQKKQQDKMLQQLVESLSQQENQQNKQLNLSLGINENESIAKLSHRDGDNNKQSKNKDIIDNQVQELISSIQSKLFSKFDNEDSQQIQNLLNQFKSTIKQNYELKKNQKDIQNIVNLQIKESSSLADQIIHLRTQLDKACISMMKNQKESNCQFSSMMQMLYSSKDNQILNQNNSTIFQQQESFNPNLASSIINQLNLHENHLVGSGISPINSICSFNNQNSINKNIQLLPNSFNSSTNFKDQNSENIFHNQDQQLYLNKAQSQIRFSDYKDTSYFKQQEMIEDHKYSPILSQLNDCGYLQNESFQIASPIRNDIVPFFGEMESKHILNSEENEEIQFQAECN